MHIREHLELRGLERTRLWFPAAEVRAQQARFAGNVGFESALDRALTVILSEQGGVEAPLDLAAEVGASPVCDYERARSRLLCSMNQPDSLLALVANPSENAPFVEPEHGDSLSSHWIFYLSAPELSDHGFWIGVAREADAKGEIDTWIYGFN